MTSNPTISAIWKYNPHLHTEVGDYIVEESEIQGVGGGAHDAPTAL